MAKPQVSFSDRLADARRIVSRRHTRRLLLVTLVAVFGGLLEAVGAFVVLLLLTLLVEPEGEVVLPIIGDLGQYTGGMAHDSLLRIMALVITGFFFLRAAVRLGLIYSEQRLSHNIGSDISTRMLSGYLSMPYPFFFSRTTAELIRNGHESVLRIVVDIIQPFIRVVADGFLLIFLVSALIVISPLITFAAIAIIAPLAFLLSKIINPRVKRLGDLRHDMFRKCLGILQASYGGIREIKTSRTQDQFRGWYSASRRELGRGYSMSAFATAVPRTALELGVLLLLVVLIIWTSVSGVEGEETLALMGTFAYAALRIQPAVTNVVKGIASMRFGAAALKSVKEDFTEIEELAAEVETRESGKNATGLGPFDKLSLVDVSYTYPGADAKAIKGLTFELRRGDWVGIGGTTGGGKTTLLDIIAGLISPSEGEVYVNGQSLDNLIPEWWKRISIVSQETFLFDATLRENIALGVPEREIDETRLLEVADKAALNDLIDKLPYRLETRVGERGTRLSGGERQRTAIARALYFQPELLFLDEATSALDSRTEAAVVSCLAELKNEITVVMVAHRISTLQVCDIIYVVEDGAVVRSGTYEEVWERDEALNNDMDDTHT